MASDKRKKSVIHTITATPDEVNDRADNMAFYFQTEASVTGHTGKRQI